MKVTVIVPFYQGFTAISGCLKALSNQTRPAHEVLIVNNGSSRNLRPLKKLTSFNPKIKVIHQSTPGSYAARNKGIEKASGDVLAFTDSDAIPSESWLESAIKEMSHSKALTILGGAIETFPRDSLNPNIFEIYDQLFFLQQKMYVNKFGYAVTANLITTKSVFKKVGLFNPAMKSCGDIEWGFRAKHTGIKATFCPKAIIRHPLRNTFAALEQKVRRVQGGLWMLKKAELDPFLRLHDLLRETSIATDGQYAKAKQLQPILSQKSFASLLQVINELAICKVDESVLLAHGQKPKRT